MKTCCGTEIDGSLEALTKKVKSSAERVVSSSSIAFGLLVCRFPTIIPYETNAGTFLMGGYGRGLIDLYVVDTMKLSLFRRFRFILFGPKRPN